MSPVKVLAVRYLQNAALSSALGTEKKCLAMVTTDCDDATYIALDEATKAADAEVVYARSFYAGAANATQPYAGEVIGILGADTPGAARSAMEAALSALKNLGFAESGGVNYLAHTVSSAGSFLSREAGVPLGSALAYLIAPPLESLYGLDAALKAADVKLCVFYGPPSQTNFGGGLLTGSAQYAYDSGPMMYVYGIVGSGGGLYGYLNYTADTCRQCNAPQCMNICPIGAIPWQQKEGCITVDHKRCIGCSACTTACPWMMATVNTESKKSSKCVLCGECANACPTGALKIIE